MDSFFVTKCNTFYWKLRHMLRSARWLLQIATILRSHFARHAWRQSFVSVLRRIGEILFPIKWSILNEQPHNRVVQWTVKQYCKLKLLSFSTYLEFLERRIFQNLSCSRAARPCGTLIQRSFLIQQGFFPWAGYRNNDLSQKQSLFSNNGFCKRVRKSLPIHLAAK